MAGGGDGIDHAARAREVLGFSRWWQVVAAAIMMGLVSPYQYVWSSIESPLAESVDVSPAAIGLVFTLFVVVQAGSQFPVGWWRDRHGPRRLSLLAGVLAGGGYLGLAYATRIWQIYVLYSLGALGVGIVYTVAVNTALKWFPDRRGLTTGVGTMAFAAGSALAVPYVRANATVGGYADVLRNVGLLIGIGILVGALVLRDPPAGWVSEADDSADEQDAGTANDPDAATDGPGYQYEWREAIRTWQFWLMYAMFLAGNAAGLMLTAKIVSYAVHHDLGGSIATISATLLPVGSGIARPIVGAFSDRFGRESSMSGALLLTGLFVLLVIHFARIGADFAFVAAVFSAVFFWSAQYSLFPSAIADYYGTEHSSANYALLYSAKIWGGVFGGVFVGWLVTVSGWDLAFALGGVLTLLTGLVALGLRPPEPHP